MAKDKTSPASSGAPRESSRLSGEENNGQRVTPRKDLGSSIVIGAVAVAAIIMSVQIDVPGSAYTAPGLLPFVIGFTLLFMAIGLGLSAVRAGGADDLLGGSLRAAQTYLSHEEGRRALTLIALVVLYVLLVALIDFELSFPTPVLLLEVSSFEVISILMVSGILRLFWRAPLLRCLGVALVTVLVLAAIFRYGFGIVMPEQF